MEPDDHVTETSQLTGKPGGPIPQKERIEPSPSSSKAVISVKNACMSDETKKTLLGLVIVALLAVSWAGAQQFAQVAVRRENFYAPFFATWFSTCWMMFCYPLYLLFVTCAERSKEKIVERIKESKKLFGQHPVTLTEFLKIIWGLNAIWLTVNCLYFYGLKFIAATVASAIMVSNVAFVYILSLCWLHERLYAIRVLATLLCISGVVLFSYAEGFQGSKDMLKGVIMVIISAFGAAVYKVVFKRVIHSGTLGQVSLFLSMLGLSNYTLMWVMNVFLYAFGLEQYSFDNIPWEVLAISAVLSLLFNFTVNLGIAYTYPLFISIGMMLGLPVNAGIDIFVHGASFSVLSAISGFLIFAGFGVIMIFPDSWNDPIHKLFGCKTVDESPDLESTELQKVPTSDRPASTTVDLRSVG